MKNIRESQIESYLSNQIKNIGGLSYKFTSVVNGVPDQIVIYNGGMYLIEVKRPNETPRPSQVLIHERIEEQDVPVYVIDTYEGVDDFITQTLNVKDIPELSTKKDPVIIYNKNAFNI